MSGSDLEDDVALRRSVPMVPERRQAEGVSGAVREIEPALQRVRAVLSVLQSRQPGPHETIELLRVRSLLGEDVAWSREVLKR